MSMGRQKRVVFSSILSKVHKQLAAWRVNLFSARGNEVLIKAVAQAIPTYTMSPFRIPITLLREIESLIAKFWWGGDEGKRKIHWKRWEAITTTKSGEFFEPWTAS